MVVQAIITHAMDVEIADIKLIAKAMFAGSSDTRVATHANILPIITKSPAPGGCTT